MGLAKTAIASPHIALVTNETVTMVGAMASIFKVRPDKAGRNTELTKVEYNRISCQSYGEHTEVPGSKNMSDNSCDSDIRQA